MFKKTSKLNIRKRRDDEDDNSDDGSVAAVASGVQPSAVLTQSEKKKDKIKKSKEPKKSSLLSFDDGEEDDMPILKVKKSSRSRRIAKEIKKRSQLEKEALSNSTKPNGNAKSSIIEEDSKNVHIFQAQKPKQSPQDGDNNTTSSKSQNISAIPNFDSGVIPSPSLIHAARKQREMLRKFGSEYISSEDTQKFKEETKSRLIRDDDDDSSEDGIMEMKGIVKKNSSKKYVPHESDDDKKEADEEGNADEEVSRWEEEMIKKGINAQTNQTGPSLSQTAEVLQQANYYNAYGDNYLNNTGQTEINPYSYRRVEAKSDLSFEIIKKRLEDHLEGLKIKNESNVNEMDKLAFDTSECEHMSKHLGDIKTISKEYQFYQEMRQYVKDLVGCLRENVRVIRSLEESALALWKNQAERIIERRRQDIQDESKQVTSSNKGMQDKSSNDADFIQRVREREARRTRRRGARQIQQNSSSHYDGLSSDDEETTMDQAHFKTEMDRIRTASAAVFDDVLDDFCNLRNILKRFDDWRTQHNNSYNDAYIALCIPKLLFPFIKQQLILWNPLLPSTRHFEEEEWYKELSVFGLKLFPLDGYEDSANVLDDTKVVSSVVEKVLFVKFTNFIHHIWDPMSTRQTVQLSLLLKELNRDYSFMTSDNHQCQKLIQVLCKRLQTAVDNDIFIPLLPPSSEESPASIFLERQTWSCIKLFKNVMLLDGILSHKVLCEIAFDSILNRYILLALQTSVRNVSYKCKRIVESIPKQWIKQHDDVKVHLSSLARFLNR